MLTAALYWGPRSGRWVVAALLAVESALLVSAGTIQIGSSWDGATSTPAVAALKVTIGDALVGSSTYGPIKLSALGIPPEADIFGIHQLGLFDPIVSKSCFDPRQTMSDGSPGSVDLDHYCPQVTTLSKARELRVDYLLVRAGKL